jgi:hydrogenase maturation protease
MHRRVGMESDLLVIGLGSPHGDDQAGWLVVEQLRQRGLTDAVAVSDPAAVLDLLAPYRRVILVDACRTGAAPGTFLRLQWPDERIGARSTCSTHGLSIVEVLTLAEHLDRLPEDVVFYGVEIERSDPATDPTASLRAAIAKVAERILREIAGAMSGPDA